MKPYVTEAFERADFVSEINLPLHSRLPKNLIIPPFPPPSPPFQVATLRAKRICLQRTARIPTFKRVSYFFPLID